MGASPDARLANLLGAVATGLADDLGAGATAAGAVDRTAATALVALLDFTPSGSIRRLSQVLGLTHAGCVRLVDRLVQSGYVARTPGADDRSISVELTPPGRRTARKIRRQRQRSITAALAGLTDQQREQLTAACEVLITNLTRSRLAQRAQGTPPAGGALCRMCDFAACGRPAGRCPAALAAGHVT